MEPPKSTSQPTSHERHELERHLERVRRGDLRAFEPVVLMFERPVRGWIAGRCPPGADADEIAQQTFIAAYKGIDSYEPGTDFRAWLFAIAKFKVMSECTRLRRVADYHSRYAQAALAVEVERRVGAAQDFGSPRMESLAICLEQAGEAVRELLAWRYRDELPLAEIAARTARSVGAIKKHLHRVRRELRECIERRLAEQP